MPVDLVFDLDGTLSDPVDGFVRSLNYALAEHGLPKCNEEELKKFIGPPLDQTFRAVLGLDDAADVGSLVLAYRERYSTIGYSENEIYAVIPEALISLKTFGMTLGVCTSKPTDFAERIISMFNI